MAKRRKLTDEAIIEALKAREKRWEIEDKLGRYGMTIANGDEEAFIRKIGQGGFDGFMAMIEVMEPRKR